MSGEKIVIFFWSWVDVKLLCFLYGKHTKEKPQEGVGYFHVSDDSTTHSLA